MTTNKLQPLPSRDELRAAYKKPQVDSRTGETVFHPGSKFPVECGDRGVFDTLPEWFLLELRAFGICWDSIGESEIGVANVFDIADGVRVRMEHGLEPYTPEWTAALSAFVAARQRGLIYHQLFLLEEEARR